MPSLKPTSNLSELHARFDKEQRVYNPAHDLQLEINGQQLGAEVLSFEVDGGKFVTRERICTVVNGEGDTDATLVNVGGWGESSAQSDGDLTVAQYMGLKSAGYENPKIVGINTGGKTNERYAEGRGVSWTGYNAERRDAGRILLELVERGDISGDVYLMGHSMGSEGAKEAFKVLQNSAQIREQIGGQVKGVILAMPVSDAVLRSLRSGRYMNIVARSLWPILKGLSSGKGIILPDDVRKKMMYTNDELYDAEHDVRGVQASILRAVGLTTSVRRKNAAALKNPLLTNGVRFDVLQAERDGLLSDAVERGIAEYLHGKLALAGDLQVLEGYPHAIPFNMSDAQYAGIYNAMLPNFEAGRRQK